MKNTLGFCKKLVLTMAVVLCYGFMVDNSVGSVAFADIDEIN